MQFTQDTPAAKLTTSPQNLATPSSELLASHLVHDIEHFRTTDSEIQAARRPADTP